jgi:hypothetical protein
MNLSLGCVEHMDWLDRRVDLVLRKRYSGCVPDWVAGAYTGAVAATVRLSGQRLYVDLPETELRCVGGGTGALRVSGRVVAREESQNFDMDQRLFARWQARASGQAEPEATEP